MSNITTVINHCEKHGDYEAEQIRFASTQFTRPCMKCGEEKKQAKIDEEIESKEKTINLEMLECGVSRRYLGIDLKKYTPLENQLLAHKAASRFVEVFDVMCETGKTIIFYGPSGTGKTMLSQAMIQSLGHGKYSRAIDISREVRESYSLNTSEKSAIKKFTDPQFLVLDEVGVQSMTGSEKILLTDVIDRRSADLKPTVLVSNLDGSELENLFGARAWSRLMQDCFMCPINGKDQRQTGVKK